MKPFTYLIGWTLHNKWYYGARFSKQCCPEDLWTRYFTSSEKVREFRKEFGEPDVVEIRQVFDCPKKAVAWEKRVLTKIRAKDRDSWLNQSNGHKGYNPRKWTDVQKAKMSAKYMGKKRPEVSQKLKGKPRPSHVIEALRSSNLGRKPSEKNRINRLAAITGKKRCPDSVRRGSEKLRGQVRSAEHKSKLSSAMTGKILPSEQKAKIALVNELAWLKARQKACVTVVGNPNVSTHDKDFAIRILRCEDFAKSRIARRKLAKVCQSIGFSLAATRAEFLRGSSTRRQVGSMQ